MAVPKEICSQLHSRFSVLLPHLNERQRRLALATEARLIGHGGVRVVARIAQVSETTVRRGVSELEAGAGALPDGRVRVPGGGRKRAEANDPALLKALLGLVEPDERGDPQSPLRWTTKSLRNLAEELTRQGHPVSAPTVGRLLKREGFSLQANVKTLEGSQHPDRDAQFRYINTQVKQHQADGEPVISVDTKKREQIGRLPMAGREWRPRGEPVEVEDHHFFFSGPDVQQAIPYGIYDIARNTGWVNVGVDHDTSVFAVESIRRWWRCRGSLDYPKASRLLITSDAGGSNGYRYRVWKSELAALAAETGLTIMVCHFPPGTSKWNKIEHRLFSHITHNWRGRPLTSHDVVIETIAATRTRAGLRVEAQLDPGDYPTGIAISRDRFAALPLVRHEVHGQWNYTLLPAPSAPQALPTSEAHGVSDRRRELLARLADPRLTGVSGKELAYLRAELAPLQAARSQERYSEQRGGRARRATGNQRAKPLFDDAARVLLTLLYQRQVCSMKLLADMLEVTPECVGHLVAETRRVLEDHGHQPGYAPTRFTTADALIAFLDTDQTPPRTRIMENLSHPRLTGMSRAELDELTRRLAPRQIAQVERASHQRRGADRQPGSRGGVFPQKLGDRERVVVAILYLRKLCTLDVLADALGDVSRSSIGNVVREIRPLLAEAELLPPPAATRYRTASDLLAAADE
ncbi:ISAzo13 family transposase [Streptomyces lancefieldiae]|uniref:ISAzo13 family transposase n=1 Tax=Streptomyces lancefieldiae TaxID=3075520 RepID=A0ABU3B1V2_9ACTN|nr:ISAzo13 family transposase [Streptomyces sp. DSM 40712]MDT0616431.1 ISAzo13 family transposase [Streptomyces sp. DSM 40712]